MKINLQLFAIDYSKYSDKGLRTSIRSHLRQIEEHRRKIADPEVYVTDYHLRSEQYQAGIIRHWKMEIVNFEKQLEMARDELKRREQT